MKVCVWVHLQNEHRNTEKRKKKKKKEFQKETTEICPLYLRYQHPLYQTKWWIIGSNVDDTGIKNSTP